MAATIRQIVQPERLPDADLVRIAMICFHLTEDPDADKSIDWNHNLDLLGAEISPRGISEDRLKELRRAIAAAAVHDVLTLMATERLNQLVAAGKATADGRGTYFACR